MTKNQSKPANSLTHLPPNRSSYFVRVLSDALTVMECIEQSSRHLTLEEIYKKTSLPKSSVYRLLHTYVERGYLAKATDNTFRVIPRGKRFRIGYGCMGETYRFSSIVTQSIERAARKNGVELLVFDNDVSGERALANTERFIEAKLDMVINFQAEHDVAPEIAHRLSEASIPMIAVEIPHPRAVFYGVDNFKVGYEAGVMLADHALQHWKGKVDLMVGLDFDEAGPLVNSRISAAIQAVRDRIEGLTGDKTLRRDCRGTAKLSERIVAELLRKEAKPKNILIATTGDQSSFGVIEAVRRAGRHRTTALAGQNCLAEEVEEMRRPDSPMIGSVSHEAQLYGPELIELALRMLRGEPVPPYNFVQHRSVTREEVSQPGFVQPNT